MSGWQDLARGVFRRNPVFVVLLGLCPALAVTTRAVNALGLGAAVLFVLLGTCLLASLLRRLLPAFGRGAAGFRLPVYLLIIGLFVTAVDLFLQARLPALRRELGIFVPLITVNCIVLGRAEAFASRHGVFRSLLDAAGTGLGFTLALLLIAAVREVLGAGTLTLFAWAGFPGVLRVPGLAENPARAVLLAPGALLVVGFLKGFFNWTAQRRETRGAGHPSPLSGHPSPLSGRPGKAGAA